MRIYEKARELGIPSKELIGQLQKLGFKPKTASSSFTKEMDKALSKTASSKPKEDEKKQTSGKKSGDSRRARLDAILKNIGKASGSPVSPQKIASSEKEEEEEKVPEPKPVPKTEELEKPPKPKKKKKLLPLKIFEGMTPQELATILDVEVKEILRTCISFGVMITSNQRLELDVIEAVAQEYGYFAILVSKQEFYAPEPKIEKEPVGEEKEEEVIEEKKDEKGKEEEDKDEEEEEEVEIKKKTSEEPQEKPKDTKTKLAKGKPKKKPRKKGKKTKGKKGAGEQSRAPIVTVMGHVDHGKTTLLDYIRNANVVGGEKGGITQHIGAYEVKTKSGKITFIDTPGHEAFTQMRARGADVTDIVVLVVSQDDGVMPQTKEAIDHAKAADVPIIVAINKMDLPGASADRVKNDLTQHGVVVEDWGGDILNAEISALQGEGVDHLMELILLQAEMMELTADPHKPAKGFVVESELDKFCGAMATLLVLEGTLKVGDSIITGEFSGRIRSMQNDEGDKIKEAKPSTPVYVMGLGGVPQAGEDFYVVENDSKARKIAEKIKEDRELEDTDESSDEAMTLEDFYSLVEKSELKELPLVLKADVDGSLEAIKGLLENIESNEVSIKFVHCGVGAISENDVLLASTSGAVVIGFNVKPDSRAKKAAEKEKVDIKLYGIIYELEEDVKAALSGMLEPDIVEEQIGIAEIRQVFQIPKRGKIAGSYIQNGVVRRGAKVKILRVGEEIGVGEINGLRRFKDDVKEVATGYECGIEISGNTQFKEGDILEIYEVKKIARRLK